MIIGIDIDDTITKTSEATDICARKFFKEVLNKPFEILKYDVTSPYWMQEKYGWNNETFDNFKTCKLISELGIRTWMMNSMLNKNLEPENFERVYDWKEIEQKFNELI